MVTGPKLSPAAAGKKELHRSVLPLASGTSVYDMRLVFLSGRRRKTAERKEKAVKPHG